MSVESGVGFSWADYLERLNLPPTAGLSLTEGVMPPEWAESWVSKSEQEKARDIAALMLPIPMMSFTTFQTLALQFPQVFSIANVSSKTGSLNAFGSTETGVTLAAAFVWAQKQNQESSLVRLLVGSAEKNPLELALNQFVADAKISPVDGLALQLVLRQMPVLTAVIKTVDPALVLKAYTIAEQQIVLSLLDKWIESLGQLAEIQKEEAKKDDILLQQVSLKILRDYFVKVSEKGEGLSQTVLSTLIGSLITSSSSVTTAAMASPFVASLAGAGAGLPVLKGIPLSVQELMGALSVGVISAATAWATPIAMALIVTGGTLSSDQAAYDAAKAFGVSISAYLMNPALEGFIASQLTSAKEAGLITESQVSLLTATFRTALLIHSMATLYKAEVGGVTGKELLSLLNGSLPVKDANYLHTLITLVNDSLKALPPDISSALVAQLVQYYDQELQVGSVTEPVTSFLDVWRQNLSPEASAATHV